MNQKEFEASLTLGKEALLYNGLQTGESFSGDEHFCIWTFKVI